MGRSASTRWLQVILLCTLTTGCWQASHSGAGDPSGTDADTYGDSDADSDADSDSDDTDTFPDPDVEPGELLWAKRAGGLGLDQARGIAALPDGSCAVVGTHGSSATFGKDEANETTLPIEGYTDGFVARFGFDGNLVWARRIGGPELDHAYDVAVLDDSSMIVVGDFEQDVTLESGSSAGASLDSIGGTDGFIARYSLSGDNEWARAIGGAGTDATDTVATGNSSGFRVLGVFEETVVLGEGEPNEAIITATGNEDVYVASYDIAGGFNWGTEVAAVYVYDNDYWYAHHRYEADTAPNGSTLFSGSWACPATFAQDEPEQVVLTGGLAMVACFDADGVLDFAFADGTNGWGHATSIASIPDGSFAIAGLFDLGLSEGPVIFGQGQTNETELVPPGNISEDVFIARYSSGSTLEWAIQAGGWTLDAALDIEAVADDGLVVTGFHGDSAFFDPGGANEVELEADSYGQQRVFVARYDLDGHLVWATSAGGGSQAAGQAIAVGADGCILVAGLFTGTAVFGNGEPHETELKSAGQWDIFVAKYAP